MWLLSTECPELKGFGCPEDVPGGYAILSHVWLDKEQSFPDIYSAEPSEAINSMHSWYTKAKICYAYLHDVPDAVLLESPKSAFRKSKWFRRGWTLQELIAPRYLRVFVSTNCTYLGTKSSLANLLSDITGIDRGVLTFRRDLQELSVSRRMSWVSVRDTARAHGPFGVTMPTIYGEGRGAFRRLQEEIMKRSPDQTLFAWGRLTLHQRQDVRSSRPQYSVAPACMPFSVAHRARRFVPFISSRKSRCPLTRTRHDGPSRHVLLKGIPQEISDTPGLGTIASAIGPTAQKHSAIKTGWYS
ncbi:hypothetical protein C8Q79DRAFT_1001855 [Trametes meyenii]|nr:hypothetical protein C8Q79DRAFT_1001855 [Trametes meyenii]